VVNGYAFRHPFRTPLAPLGVRSNDGRTLSISGRYSLQGVAPIFPFHRPDQIAGFITRVDAQDGWLWARGAMAVQWQAIHMRDGLLALCMDMDITDEYTMLNGVNVTAGEVRAARLSTPDRWAWGDMWPAT
jgi:hypothetical protein